MQNALIDRVPDSERNKLLYSLFHTEYKSLPKGKEAIQNLLERHPLTLPLQCLMATMACAVGFGGDPDGFTKFIAADGMFSTVTLLLELSSSIGQDANRKLVSIQNRRTSQQGMSAVEEMGSSLVDSVPLYDSLEGHF